MRASSFGCISQHAPNLVAANRPLIVAILTTRRFGAHLLLLAHAATFSKGALLGTIWGGHNKLWPVEEMNRDDHNGDQESGQ